MTTDETEFCLGKMMRAVRNLHLLAIAFLAVTVTAPVAADLVTIDFDGFAPTSSFASGTEDNFVIGNTSGPVAVSGAYLGPSSGTNSIHHQSPGVAIFEISHVLGELFELEHFQAGSDFGSVVQFTVSGFLGGSLVGSNTFTPIDGSYTQFTASNLIGVQVDRVVFNLGQAQIGPTHVDNIVVNTVSIPEPNMAAIGFGLFAIALVHRRQSR